jgi:hypothetical protein
MRGLLARRLAFSALAMILPASALAQASIAYDGVYAGVSIEGAGQGKCTTVGPMPRPLTISGGNARTVMGSRGELRYQGTVNAEGMLTLHDDAGTPMTGKIDAGGNATASVPGIKSVCTYHLTWRKR